MMPSQHMKLVRDLVDKHIGGAVQEIVDISTGFSGSSVYSVRVMHGQDRFHCIAKFTPAAHSADDSVTNRVYGSLASNFNAAYFCLQQHQVPLPKLYAAYSPQPDIPYDCQLMEYLPGEEVRSALKSTPAEKQSALQHCLGMELGAIHQITRAYDGWIELAAPNPPGWREAFFLALRETLASARNHGLVTVQYPAIAHAIDHFETKWSEPSESRRGLPRGFLGVALRRGWR